MKYMYDILNAYIYIYIYIYLQDRKKTTFFTLNVTFRYQLYRFREVPNLERGRGFQSCDFIDGFLCSGMSRCFKPEMLWDLSIQPT